MTLPKGPSPSATPRPEERDTSSLVIRLNKQPRVPWWYWLRHPWRAWWISLLIREAFRWRDVPNSQPDALTWAEKALFERAQRAQGKAIATVAANVEKLADEYQALRAKSVRERTLAALERKRRFTPRTEVHVYAAGPMSMAEAKDVIAKCQRRIVEDTSRGHTRHQERPSKVRNRASAAPLLVDIVALMAVIARFFNVTIKNALDKVPEAVATVGFSLIASLVLALLAHSAGHAAGHLRAVSGRAPGCAESTDGDDAANPLPVREFPSARLMLYAKLACLFVVSTMVAVSIATRIMHPTATVSTGLLGVMIGILVGFAAFLAPWLIVMNLMRSGSLETRTIDTLTAMVRDIEATVTDHEKAAVQADQQAEHVRQSAERAQIAEFESAMNITAATRQIVELARSFHTEAGRFALADNAVVDDPYLSMRSAIATDSSAIDKAKQRFDLLHDENDDQQDDEQLDSNELDD